MIRYSTLISVVFTIILGALVFHLKYQVMYLEKYYQKTTKNILEIKSSLHVLKAEWAHLNEPHRLQSLAQTYLNHQPIKPTQIMALDHVKIDNPLKEASMVVEQQKEAPSQAPHAYPSSLDDLISQVIKE